MNRVPIPSIHERTTLEMPVCPVMNHPPVILPHPDDLEARTKASYAAMTAVCGIVLVLVTMWGAYQLGQRGAMVAQPHYDSSTGQVR